MWIRVKLMIFMIKLILLQNYTHLITPDKHFIKIHTTFYQNTCKYYNFWHLRRDGPTAGPKNFPSKQHTNIYIYIIFFTSWAGAIYIYIYIFTSWAGAIPPAPPPSL